MKAVRAVAGALALLALAASAQAAPRPSPPRVLDAFAPSRGMFARQQADSGYSFLRGVIARAEAARDDTLRVAAQFELGARASWFGAFSEAVPALRRALSGAWAMRDSTRWVQSSQWLAFALNSQDRVLESAPVARRALPAAVALGARSVESYLRLSLAYADLRQGRPVAARRNYARALAGFDAQQDAYGAGEALLGLGRTYSATGPRDSALALFRRAARRAADARLPRVAASAYNDLAAGQFETGDPERALATWREAAHTLRTTGDLPSAITAGGNVCMALAQAGRLDEARAAADTLLADARRAGSPELVARVQGRLGLIELHAGRPAAAARAYRAGLAGSLGAVFETRLDCVAGLIRALQQIDSIPAALALYDEVAGEVQGRTPVVRRMELAAAGAGVALAAGDPARAAAIAAAALPEARASRVPLDEMDLERILALADAALGRLASARTHLERSRTAWQRRREQAKGLEWRTSFAHAAALGDAWATVELGTGIERRRPRIARAFGGVELLRSSVLLELAAGPGGRAAAPPPVTLDALQSRVLAPGELLLVAWTGGDRGWWLAISRDTAFAVPLPGAMVLARDVDLLRQSLAADPPLPPQVLEGMLADAGQRLLGACLSPLRRARRVLVVPAGPLQRLPIEALVLPLGAGGAPAALGTARAVARVPSASLLALTRARAARTAKRGLLVIAHPRGPDGTTLPEVLDEARELGARYRDVTRLDSPRDAASVLRAIATAPALHVAAHAEFDSESPWRSALHVGDQAVVHARDVLGLRTSPAVVVLAACQTAGGEARGTGGMEGLGAAFLCAGSRAVIATLWPVEDRAARRFVAAFYRECETAPDAGTALARARRRLQAEQPGPPPRDWAAFTLVGDPAARLGVTRKWLSLPKIN